MGTGPALVTQTAAAGVSAADTGETTSCSASGSPLASGAAVPAEAVMTHFNS